MLMKKITLIISLNYNGESTIECSKTLISKDIIYLYYVKKIKVKG